MATASLPENELIELLIQLQKTTPDQARTILSSQPQITYALMSLMVKMNLVNVDVLQSQLAAYAASSAPPVQQPTQAAPSVPAHLMQPQPQAAPPPQLPTYPPAQTYPSAPAPPPHVQPHYQAPQGAYSAPGMNGQAGYAGRPGYGQPMPPPPAQQQPVQPPQAQPNVGLPDALAGMPEEQRNMIMRVVQMTPDQVARLPPNERQSVMQLRATLGLPME